MGKFWLDRWSLESEQKLDSRIWKLSGNKTGTRFIYFWIRTQKEKSIGIWKYVSGTSSRCKLVCRVKRFLGGVRFLTTLGIGVGFLVRLCLWRSNWIICYITQNSRNSFETFIETGFLLCTKVSIDFNSQISLGSFHVRWSRAIYLTGNKIHEIS